VKVFKKSLVQEFGKQEQLERIERELTLRNHDHPNLIQILDGGECPKTGFLYVVMELIDAPNVASVISQIPRERIRSIIAQIADAAHYLESRGIVHRDIKPDNIAITRDSFKPTLLDLGVIRPLDISKLTDPSDEKRESFLGTMRYSPPEYIFRTEDESEDGYRAITFYQLGGVLHDLIMKERLFEAYSKPKARLVKAVELETPTLQQADVPQDLVLLAQNCLLKRPELRLRFVNWEHFQETKGVDKSEQARMRVMRRFAASLDSSDLESRVTKPVTAWDSQRTVNEVQQRLTNTIKAICVTQKILPRTTTTELPSFDERSANVLIVFEAAPTLEMKTALAVLVTAQIIDIIPASVSVSVRAFRGYDHSEEHLAKLKTCEGHAIIESVFEDVTMKSSLESALFNIVDLAQAGSSEAGCIEIRRSYE
jgi:serine/threonine protein kinase